jgi:hypothetical protein
MIIQRNGIINKIDTKTSPEQGESPAVIYSVTDAFIEKTPCAGRGWRNLNLKPVEGSIQQLAADIQSGLTVTHLYRDGKRAKDNLLIASYIPLDFDTGKTGVQDVQQHSLGRYVGIIHPSASHTPEVKKTHAFVILETPITDAGRYELAARALQWGFIDLEPDKSTTDAARAMHGSKQPGMVVNPVIMPDHILNNLIVAYEATHQDTMAESFRPSYNPDANPDYEAGKQALIADIIRASGAEFSGDKKYSKNFLCPFHQETTPSAGLNRQTGAIKCFVCGHHDRKEVAEVYHINWRDYFPKHKPSRRRKPTPDTPKAPFSARIKPVDLPSLDPDFVVNLPYIGDLDPDLLEGNAGILIQSALATGKTEFVKRYKGHLERKLGHTPSVLYVTHLQALAANIAARLELELYLDIPGGWLGSASQLVISYDSLHKLGQDKHYDLVVIDEIEQFSRHLFGGTMRGGEPDRAYTTLKSILQNAGQFIALDAHLSPVSVDYARAVIPGEVAVITNSHQRAWGKLTLHEHADSLIQAALDLIDENSGTVVITTNQRKQSEVVYQMVVDQIGAGGVMLVNGWTSESDTSQKLIRNINTELPKLRALVCSPSMATGIDVQAQVAGVFGLFFSQPAALSPTDYLQMLGRFRSARERHAFVEDYHASEPTDWQAIYPWDVKAAQYTAAAAGFSAYEIEAAPDHLKAVNKLHAMISAHRNAHRNDLLSAFVHLATAEGYEIVYQEEQRRDIARLVKETRARVAEARKEQIVAAPAVTADELELYRQQGTITPRHRFGFERWKIEDTIGLEITSDLYDLFHSRARREALRRFTDLETDLNLLQERDRKQAEDRYLLTSRGHYTEHRSLIVGAIDAVFGDLDDTSELSAGDISERLQPYLTTHLDKVQAILDRRADLSEDPVCVFRRILSKIGVKLGRRQVMVNGQRFMVYSIDRDSVARMRHFAGARRRFLDRKAEAITTNTYSHTALIRVCSNGSAGGLPACPEYEANRDLDDLMARFMGVKT